MLSHSLAFVLAYYVFISTAVPTPGTTCYLSKSIYWRDCDIFGYNTLDAVKPQCGYFTVPADYKNWAVGSVNLAVVRRPATAKPKLGTILVNPGNIFTWRRKRCLGLTMTLRWAWGIWNRLCSIGSCTR